MVHAIHACSYKEEIIPIKRNKEREKEYASLAYHLVMWFDNYNHRKETKKKI